jgi:tetratricopeptide (TPR) repeat protein
MRAKSNLSQHVRWRRRTGVPRLGVIMIVKNEAARLPKLFRSIATVADEVVVVDTGSTDDTQLVCKRWGVRLIQERWHDDFARARNRSIEAASARYLLWLDADDVVPPESARTLCELRDHVLPHRRDLAFVLPVENLDARGGVIDVLLQTRIFPRGPKYRFRHAIHEQITPSLLEGGVELQRLPAPIRHAGYAHEHVVRQKAERNEALLLAALERDPESVHHLVHLAQTQAGVGRCQEADRSMTDAIHHATRKGTVPGLLAEYHTLRATYRILVGNEVGAVYDLERAEALWPEWGLPSVGLIEILMREAEWDAAWAKIETARSSAFGPGVHGFRLARSRSNLELFAGRILRRRGELEAAEACIAAALEFDPENVEARMELGEMLVGRRAWQEAREVLEPAGSMAEALHRLVDLSVAVALVRVMTDDFEGARACLAPLLDVFAVELGGAEDVGPTELAAVLLRTGHLTAAKHMLLLCQATAAQA